MDPIQMMLPLGCIYLINNYMDVTNPQQIVYCRIFYAVSTAFMGILMAYLYKVISTKNETVGELEVVIKPPPPFGPGSDQPGEIEKMTIRDHDMYILQARAKQLGMQTAVMALLHGYFGMVQPLILSAIIGVYGVVKWEIFKVHVLGQSPTGDLKRPWSTQPKGSNPFEGLSKLKDELQGGEEETPVATRGKPTTSLKSLKKRVQDKDAAEAEVEEIEEEKEIEEVEEVEEVEEKGTSDKKTD